MFGRQSAKNSGNTFPDLEEMNVSSTTECTGLMYRPPMDEDELDSYQDLYDLEYSDIDDGV